MDPLDEATRRTLRHHPDRVRTWVDGAGFAILVDDELTLVVSPASRGTGAGTALLGEVLGETHGPLVAWSHSDHPAARVLAAAYSARSFRELWVMRRAAAVPLPARPLDDDLDHVRPGDEAEVLRVNAVAFAHHPEQGGMDAEDLAARMAEPWFDPAGLIVAREGDRLLGFHWTKQHSRTLGEVYVVGIDPAAQGRGLGTRLTLAGLHHLTDLGVAEIELYVESDNAAAVAVYTKLGFTHAPGDTHVMYRLER